MRPARAKYAGNRRRRSRGASRRRHRTYNRHVASSARGITDERRSGAASPPPRACPPTTSTRSSSGASGCPRRRGPSLVRVTADGVFDLSASRRRRASCSNFADAAAAIRARRRVAAHRGHGDGARQLGAGAARRPRAVVSRAVRPAAIKAAGVTFVVEHAGARDRGAGARRSGEGRSGAPRRRRDHRRRPFAACARARAEAARLKDALIAQGVWSQYLEVGIGPDAEIFTKSQPMSAVGIGADIGIHPEVGVEQSRSPRSCSRSTAAAKRSARRSATTSTCATSRAAARCCSARPRTTTRRARSARSSACSTTRFGIDDVRRCELAMRVDGPDGFVLDGASSIVDDQPRSARPRRAGDRAEPPVSGRLRAVPRHDVRADQGPACAGAGLHARGRRHRDRGHAEARRARQPRRALRPRSRRGRSAPAR